MTFPTFDKLAAAIWPSPAVDADKADIRAYMLTHETALNALFAGHAMINGQLEASVNSSALTVALKTHAGADPSTSDPVYVAFRNSTLADGSEDILEITAALSITVSGGSTLGGVDGEPSRFWIVIFNDSGTPRLGIINCLMRPTSFQIYRLNEYGRKNSTAEGGAGAADSAGVIYTDSAVSAKPIRIIGHVTYETNPLATAGIYAAAPDLVTLTGPGHSLPGDVLQIESDIDGELNTTTTTTPADDTLPQQSTEGETHLSVTVAPLSDANVFRIEAESAVALSAAGTIVSALHKDSGEDALCARHIDIAAANDSGIIRLQFIEQCGAGSRTYKINNGPTTGTLSFNGINAARTMGGVNYSFLQVTELMC